MNTTKEWQKKGRQLANKFVRNEFIVEEAYEEKISDVKEYFRYKYPDTIIEEHRNKLGTRIVVYEKKHK